MNLGGMLDHIRIRTGDPRTQQPSDRTLLLLLNTQVQNFLNEANLTGRAWAVDELSLTAVSGIEDYALPIDSHFGKPIQVRTVYPSNPGMVERNVPFVDLGSLNFDWRFPKNFGSSLNLDGSPNNAVQIAFFRKMGQDQVWARILPIPGQSAQYQVLYQIGVYGETESLDETPFLPQHHALIEVRTAIAALPLCVWEDDPKFNIERRKELAMTLSVDQDRLERNFRRSITSVSMSSALSFRGGAFSID